MYRFTLFLAGALACHAELRRLDLRGAVELASTQAPTVAIAHLQMLEAQANERVIKSAYRPQINGVVQGAYQTTNLQGVGLIFPGFPSRVGPYRSFNLRPQATQTILDLSLLSSIQAGKLQSEQRRWDTESAREAIRLAAVQLYLQLFEARSRIAAADARIAAADALLTQSRDRESLGGASKLDIARNAQQMYAERILRAQADRDAQGIESSLKEALSLPQTDSLDLAAPLIGGDPGTAQTRPAQRALDSQSTVETQLRNAARRERMPKLSAVGDWGLQGQGPDKSLSTYQIGATLTIPIFTGGRIEADIAKAELRLRQTEQARRRLDLQIAREADQARKELHAAVAIAKESEAQRQAAATTLDLTKLRFEAGLATSTDTTTAQANLAEADEQSIRALYAKQIAQARLANALGNLDSIL